MFKKTIFAIALCLILGAGVLHAASSDVTQRDAVTATQVPEPQLADQDTAPECGADLAIEVAADAVDLEVAYECPPSSSYCRKTKDCDQANGEVCQNGCCYAAF